MTTLKLSASIRFVEQRAALLKKADALNEQLQSALAGEAEKRRYGRNRLSAVNMSMLIFIATKPGMPRSEYTVGRALSSVYYHTDRLLQGGYLLTSQERHKGRMQTCLHLSTNGVAVCRAIEIVLERLERTKGEQQGRDRASG